MKSIYVLAALLLIGSAFGLEVTEIMYNPVGTDTGREWVEVYADVPMNFSGARISDRAGSHTINLGQGSLMVEGYAIMTNNAATFIQEHPGFSETVLQAAISLSNTNDTVNISKDGVLFDSVFYTNTYANGNGKTLEKLNGVWEESQDDDGSPGFGFSEVPEFGFIAGMVALAGGLAGLIFIRKSGY
jgi:nitrate/nitrite transporter NarK